MDILFDIFQYFCIYSAQVASCPIDSRTAPPLASLLRSALEPSRALELEQLDDAVNSPYMESFHR